MPAPGRGIRAGSGPPGRGNDNARRRRHCRITVLTRPPTSAASHRKAQVGLPARRAAIALVSAVLGERMPLDQAIETAIRSGPLGALNRRDRALARAIAATVLRRNGQIEAVIGDMLDRPLPASSGMAHDILRVGAAQLLFMDVAPHAAIDLSVRAAGLDRKARHFKGLVNAVLRRIAKTGGDIIADHDAAGMNTPDWLYSRWQAAYGAATARAIAAAHLDVPALDLTVPENTDHWAAQLGGRVLSTGTVRCAGAGTVTQLEGYDDGTWWVQDAAAALPARLLGDVAGRKVIDLCAAPGGKTAQLAAAGAEVWAVDTSKPRLKRLEQNLGRLGLKAHIVHQRAERFAPGFVPDAVLLDAPCSSTGTIRRHPDILHLKSPGDIAALAKQQSGLLETALGLLRSGGRLVYCTCSLEPEEGEQIVAGALDSTPGLARVPLGVGEVAGSDPFITADGDLRTLPCHWGDLPAGSRGLDGFYAARLVRL